MVQILYRRAAEYLLRHGLRDLATGDVYICRKVARRVLGRLSHVHRQDQVEVLNELERLGLISFENRNLIKVFGG